MTPYDILVGRQMQGTNTGTMTGTGTQVTKTSPNLFEMMMGLGQAGASAYMGGMS
jgi:hypothetical protein